MAGRRASRRSPTDEDDDDDNAVVYYEDYDLPPTKRVNSASLNVDGRVPSIQGNKINKKIIDLNSLKRKTPVEFESTTFTDGAAISTDKSQLAEEISTWNEYDFNPSVNYGLVSLNSYDIPQNSTSYLSEDTQNQNQFANVNVNGEKSAANSNTKSKNVEKSKKLTAILDRPTHWNNPKVIPRPNKNARDSTHKQLTKNHIVSNGTKKSLANLGGGTISQITAHPIISVNSTNDVDSHSLNVRNISFKPPWMPSPVAKNSTRSERNEEIIDDATKFQFEPLYTSARANDSSNLLPSPTTGTATQGYFGYSKSSPPSSSHVSKFKSGHKNIGHFREKLNRIIKHVHSDELRLSTATFDSCNDPQDPRRKSCFWIDISVEDLGNSADCKPFISATVRIRNVGFNEKQVVNKINQGKFRCSDMPSPSAIYNDLNAESTLFQPTENMATTSLETNKNQYTSNIQTSFPIDTTVTALFRDLKQRVQINKIFRVYEPLKISSESIDSEEDFNGLPKPPTTTIKDAIICTNVMEECEYIDDENEFN